VGANGNSGTPHSEAWGAIITATANSAAQVSVHYDDSLADLSDRSLHRAQLARGEERLTQGGRR